MIFISYLFSILSNILSLFIWTLVIDITYKCINYFLIL